MGGVEASGASGAYDPNGLRKAHGIRLIASHRKPPIASWEKSGNAHDP